MAQYLPLPDGSSVTIREGETPQQTWARAQQMYPEAFAKKAAPPKEESAAPSSLKDIAASFGLGATGSVKALTDVFGADNAASQGLDKASEALSRSFTPERQAEMARRQEKIKEAEKTGSTWEEIKANLGAVAEAPLQSAAQGLGSIVPYALTGGAGAAAKLLPSTVRTINMFMGAAQGAGAVKGSIYDAVYDRLKQEGADEQTARQQAVEAQNYVGANFGQIGLGAGLGAAAARFGVESLLAPGAAKATAPGIGRRVGTALLEEMPLEGAQGGQERLAANLALQRQGFDVPTFQGVAGQAAQEAAMAGLAAGPVAAIRSPKEEMERKAAEDAKKAAEERQAAAQAEEAKKADPQYMFDLEKRYLAAEQQRKDLKAQLLKIDDESPTVAADRAHNKALEKQIDELGKNTIAPLAKEYAKVRPALEKFRADEEKAKVSPMEYFLGLPPEEKPTQPYVEPRQYYDLEIAAPPKAPAPLSPEEQLKDYAFKRVQLAQNQLPAPDVANYVDYLEQNPAMADALALKRFRLPGMSAQESNQVYDALKPRAKQREQQRAAETKQTFEQRASDLGAKPLAEDEQKYDEVIKFAQESKKLAEESDRSLDPLFASAIIDREHVIPVSDNVKAFREKGAAQRVRGKVEDLMVAADQADNDYAQALSAKETAAAKAAFERGNSALEQIKTMETEGGEYAKAFLAARQAQNNALAKIEDIADKLRTGETIGGRRGEMASGTTQTLTDQAAKLRSQFITAALQEAALHRRAEGKPALTQDEAIKAASQMYDTLNEWIDRVQKEPQRASMESVLVEPAQMRAHKLIRQARYEQRRVFDSRPLEEYRFGAYPQALAVLKEQLDETRRALGETPAKATREEQLLKQQFAPTEAKKVGEAKGETAKTLSGELRRHSEYTLTNLDKVLARNDLPQGGIYEGVERGQPYVYRVEDMRELLEKARDVIEDGKASRELLDAVDAQIDHIERGRHLDGTLVKSRAILSEDTVVDVVPGKEGSTRFGVKRKWGDVMKNKDLVPLSDYQQDIKDALAASGPTAIEQKEAGQKSLFPETEKDVGYLRMSPQNFANSPKIREAWAALDKARALAKKKASKAAIVKNRSAAAGRTLERIQLEIDKIKSDTKFFWANERTWTNEALAKAYVKTPDVGQTPAEVALADKFLKTYGKGMTVDEVREAKKIISHYQDVTSVEHQKHLTEARQILAQGERLEDLDNDLLRNMQDTNKIIRDHAERLRTALAPLRTAIKHIKDIGTTGKEDPLAKQINALDAKAEKARDAYRARVQALYNSIHTQMDTALAEILDPEIEKVSKALDQAQETLAKEKAELDKINKRVQDVLAQPEGKDRMQLVTYQQFRYEEKKAIIEDLEKQIKEQQADLEDTLDTRTTAHDNAAAALQAVTDKATQALRDKIVRLEKKLAEMRGEEVTAAAKGDAGVPVLKYPFAAQKAKVEADLKAAQEQLKAAERQKKETVAQIKTANQQIEDTWEKFGGFGVRRVAGKVSPLVGTEQKQADKLREEAYQAEDRAESARMRNEQKRLYTERLENDLNERIAEMSALPELPDEVAALRKIVTDETTPPTKFNAAMAKLSLLHDIEELQSQVEAFEEGKPSRKQKALTTETTAMQASRKAFRTGDLEAGVERRYQAYRDKVSYTKALSPEEFAQMEKADIEYSNKLASSIRGTKAPKIEIKPTIPSFDPKAGIDPYYDDFEFSRGREQNGLNKAELEAEIERGMGETLFGRDDERQISKKIEVFNNVDEFTAAYPEYGGKIPTDAKGFVHKGKAVLFANNIGKGHGLGVFLHEVGVHTGFRNFFNKDQYGALVNAVKNWATKRDDSIEAKVGKAALERVKAANTPAAQVDDELLAYAVEEAMRMGVSPTGVKNGTAVHNWLRMVVDAFKKVLAKFGVNPKNLTAGDFVNMAYGAAQLEIKGTWHGTGVDFDEFDHSYMGTGEGHQAFGWGTYRAQKHGLGTHYREIAIRRQVNEWKRNPEVRAWMETQEARFDGMTASEVRDFAMTGKGKGEGTGMTRDIAWTVEQALLDVNNHMKRFPDSVPSDIFKLAMYEQAEADGSDHGIKLGAIYKKFADENKFKVTGKSLSPTYRNSTDFEWNTAEWRVLSALRRDGSTAPFKERVKNAIAEVREEQERTADIFRPDQEYPADDDKEFYEDATRILKELDALDVDQFAYNPPDAPPIPAPTGAIMRVLHTRPENEYLLWDKPLEEQPPAVKKGFEAVLSQFDDKANKELLRYMQSVGKVHGRDMYTGISAVFESAGIPSKSADQFATLALHAEGVAGIKFFDRQSRDKKAGYFNYVDFGDKEEGAQIVATNIDPVRFTDGKNDELLFSRAPTYVDDDWADYGKKSETYIAKNKSTIERVRAAAGGFLGLETQLVDRFAGFERLSKAMDALKGSQMMYYLRMYDQRMNFVSQAVGTGALDITEKERADGKKEFIIESKEGPSIKGVVDILKGAKPYIGNGEAVNRMFTMYLSAIRGERVGFDKLNFGSETTEADLNGVRKKVESDAALKEIFELARNEYNAYNRNMIDFVVKTGAMSEQVGAELTSENDYIPFYRERNGAAELLIGDATPIRIGSIKEQPYLHELIGGDKPVLDFMVSSVQNTNMLADMGLRNLATKNAIFELVDLDMAKIVGKTEGPNVVKFKVDGEDRFAEVAGTPEIPGDLLVKGMEGIPTQMPFIWRAMSMPSRLLRKAVTASPLYAARQLFRDSVAAPLLSGADFTPVMGALKQIGKPTKETLERRGVVGGQQFTGTSEDLTTILRQINDGQSGWMQALAKAEAIGMEADALTRRAQYNSYIEQGLSEMEATLMALESMNFSKRGADPSVHIVGALIPFFNAQIQALNVLYKSFTGKMPFNDKLKIQEKLLKRGAMLAASTMVYAALMQDDEAYKNATPDQKYGNWFVRIPGVDEPVRIPVPFEVGYIFKALPEAMYNSMVNEHGSDEAIKAFKQILLQTIPGGTSYGLPQAIKPAIEAGLGKSFYTGRDILSQHEKMLLPEEQFRANTTEMAKLVGKLGISPIVFEHLVQGYTGTMGMAFLQALSQAVPTGNTPEQAVRRLSEMPVVGGAFQPNDAGGIINDTYDRMNELKKVKTTIDDMMESGRTAEAKAMLEKRINEYVAADMADDFTRDMRDITQLERAIRAATTMTPQEKRTKLDEMRKLKIVLAESARRAAGQIVRPSDLP